MNPLWDSDPGRRISAAELAEPDALRRRWEYGPDHAVAEGAAKNPLCPPDLLRACARYADARPYVAANPACPQDLLEEFLADPSIHWALGERWEPEILRQLPLRHIARNPACPQDLLAELTQDQSATVRSAVAGNIACPPDLQAALAVDRDVTVVREIVDRSHHTDASALRAAWRVIAARRDIWGDRLRYSLLQRKDCPADVVENAACSADPYVRRAAARNLTCPAEVIARLARDPDPVVRENAMRLLGAAARALLDLEDVA